MDANTTETPAAALPARSVQPVLMHPCYHSTPVAGVAADVDGSITAYCCR